MDKTVKSKIVNNTKPKDPDPAVVAAMKDKQEKERQEKEKQSGEPSQGTRGPKSKVTLRWEEEQKQKLFKDRCRKSGRTVCDTLVMSGYTFLGPEWNYMPPVKIQPDDPNSPVIDERTTMREAWENMFEEYGWDVVPPWLQVVTVTFAYAGTRFAMPTVREKFKTGIFKSFMERLRAQKVKPEPKPAGAS